MKAKPIFVRVLLLLIAVLVVAACGRGGDTPPTPEPAPPAVVEATEAPTAAPTAEPTDTPEPTEDATAPEADTADATATPEAEAEAASADAQPDSPLAQPDSPLAQPDSPLAQPESPLAVPQPYTLAVPEPDAETAVVRGRLIAGVPSAGVFLAGQVYLSPVEPTMVATEDGKEIEVKFLKLVRSRDPLAELRNDQAEFAFTDVPPGEYGVVVWTPMDTYVVPDPAGESFLYIDIAGGDMVDLGDIVINR